VFDAVLDKREREINRAKSKNQQWDSDRRLW